jgi:hypothetical protein
MISIIGDITRSHNICKTNNMGIPGLPQAHNEKAGHSRPADSFLVSSLICAESFYRLRAPLVPLPPPDRPLNLPFERFCLRRRFPPFGRGLQLCRYLPSLLPGHSLKSLGDLVLVAYESAITDCRHKKVLLERLARTRSHVTFTLSYEPSP